MRTTGLRAKFKSFVERSGGGGRRAATRSQFVTKTNSGFLRECLKRRDRFVDYNPRQLIFEEDRLLRCEWRRIIERRNRHIDRVGVLAVFEKQLSAATRSKRTNSIRVRYLARFALCHDHILARYRSPLQVRCTGAPPAIDAMTINQSERPTPQHVSCPATNASTSDLHKVLQMPILRCAV